MRHSFAFHAGYLWIVLITMLATGVAEAQEEQLFTLFQYDKEIGTERFTVTERLDVRTVAVRAEPLKVTGELVTDSEGVALLMMKLPADAAVRLL